MPCRRCHHGGQHARSLAGGVEIDMDGRRQRKKRRPVHVGILRGLQSPVSKSSSDHRFPSRYCRPRSGCRAARLMSVTHRWFVGRATDPPYSAHDFSAGYLPLVQ